MSLRGFVPTTLETAISQGSTYACRGMPTAGPTRKWHSVGLSRRGEAEPAVCPMCAPAVQPGPACCDLHVNHAMLAPDRIDAMPSQQEGQGLESP
jgi:hypothetical protein